MSNQTHTCENVKQFDTNSECFGEIEPPNISDCDLLLLIYRLIIVDCYIEKVFVPTAASLVVIGTILNLFSLYCFLKMNKRNSQNVYLSVLSLADTINLHVNFTVPLFRKMDKIAEYFDSSLILCRVNGFVTEFFLIFPTWIVVLLTFERLICVLWPLKCHSLYTHKRAKVSIFILAFIVMCLCLYRFYDFKGIDQVSVFAVPACDAGSRNATLIESIIRHSNLVIWAILPEFLTLIMNLAIINNIKLATQKFEPFYSKARQTKYNQATKTVLLISILFLIFHTPTGVMIALNLLYTTNQRTVGILIILVSRKITVILYEISLSCKFFIYNKTFRNFKYILRTSISRFTRQTNSAKLGRPVLCAHHSHNSRAKSFQFGQRQHNHIKQAKETDVLVRYQPKSSTRTSSSASKASREQQQQQQMSVLMIKTNESIQMSVSETPNLLRRYTTDTRTSSNNRSLWRCKPQTTL